MQVTRIPVDAVSKRNAFDMPSTKNFDPLYIPNPANAVTPASDVILIM